MHAPACECRFVSRACCVWWRNLFITRAQVCTLRTAQAWTSALRNAARLSASETKMSASTGEGCGRATCAKDAHPRPCAPPRSQQWFTAFTHKHTKHTSDEVALTIQVSVRRVHETRVHHGPGHQLHCLAVPCPSSSAGRQSRPMLDPPSCSPASYWIRTVR